MWSVIADIASRVLPLTTKKRIKALIHKCKLAYVKRFRSYDYIALLAAINDVGIRSGDVVMVHSAYSPYNGFVGTPVQVAAAVLEAVGSEGTVLMPSSPYTGSTETFVKSGKPFDMRRSPSHLGIVTEMFRRQKSTLRSKNPGHPVLANGPLASWFIEGHENFAYSCGPGTPFEKLLEKDAKVLFFDAHLAHLMFFHYLEHSVQEQVPFELYDAGDYRVTVIDENGKESAVQVHPFSEEARRRKRFPVLETELRSQGVVSDRQVGNTHVMMVRVRDSLEATRALLARGEFFYDLTGYE